MKSLAMTFYAICLAGLLVGCGSYSAVSQSEEATYLLIVGSPNSEVLSIDNGKPMILGEDTRSYDKNGKTVTQITIQPGTHKIKIERDGVVVVNRKIYVSEGNAFEVNL